MSDTTTAQSDTDKHRQGVTITINGYPFEALKRMMTGRELLALAGLPETNQIFLEAPGPGEDPPIGLDVEIKLHKGMAFYDVPVGTFG